MTPGLDTQLVKQVPQQSRPITKAIDQEVINMFFALVANGYPNPERFVEEITRNSNLKFQTPSESDQSACETTLTKILRSHKTVDQLSVVEMCELLVAALKTRVGTRFGNRLRKPGEFNKLIRAFQSGKELVTDPRFLRERRIHKPTQTKLTQTKPINCRIRWLHEVKERETIDQTALDYYYDRVHEKQSLNARGATNALLTTAKVFRQYYRSTAKTQNLAVTEILDKIFAPGKKSITLTKQEAFTLIEAILSLDKSDPIGAKVWQADNFNLILRSIDIK